MNDEWKEEMNEFFDLLMLDHYELNRRIKYLEEKQLIEDDIKEDVKRASL